MGLIYLDDTGLGSRDIGYVELERIGGRAWLERQCLVLTFKVTLRKRPDAAKLFLANPAGELTITADAGASAVLGTLAPSGSAAILPTFPSMDHPFQINLEIPLDAARLESIERLRSGGDLVFRGAFWATCHGAHGPAVTQQEFEKRVLRSEWIEFLNQVGFGRRILLEVPVPSETASPPLKNAAKHLKIAHDDLLKGEWRACVASCRDVLEAVSMGMNDPDDRDPVTVPLFEGTRSLDKAGRMRIVRRAIRMLTHAAKHVDEITTQIEWNRQDAMAVLAMVSAVAGHAAFGQTSTAA